MVLSEWQKGWLESAIDGEGTVTASRRISAQYRWGEYYQPIVNVGNTNRDYVECAFMICGGKGRIYPHDQKNNHRIWFEYRFPASVIRRMLPQLSLIIKEEQRKLVLELLDIQIGHNTGNKLTFVETMRMRGIYEKIKSLNHPESKKEQNEE